MATFDDYIPVILGIAGTLLVSTAVLLLGNHLNIWRRSQDRLVSNTFNVGGMQEDFKKMERNQEDFKEHMDRKLDGLIQLIEKKDEANTRRFESLSQQNVELDKKMVVVEFRLNDLEDNYKRRRGESQ